MEKQALVKKGYEKLAVRYDAQRNLYANRRLLKRFVKTLNRKKGRILDLGCGAGVPVARFLVQEGFSVTGIDIAPNMLRLARKNVPRATFRKMDMTAMNFARAKFDGAVAFYSIIHVPRARHATIYRRLHRILKPGGIVLAASGTNSGEYYGDFMGQKMFWSHYAPRKTLAIIRRSGFGILWSKVLKLGGERQFWVLARCR